MEMVLAFMDLWNTVDRYAKAPFSNANPKVLKEYQRYVKKAMSIINPNLVGNQFAHIKRCKNTHICMEDLL